MVEHWIRCFAKKEKNNDEGEDESMNNDKTEDAKNNHVTIELVSNPMKTNGRKDSEANKPPPRRRPVPTPNQATKTTAPISPHQKKSYEKPTTTHTLNGKGKGKGKNRQVIQKQYTRGSKNMKSNSTKKSSGSEDFEIHMDPGTGRRYSYNAATKETAWVDEEEENKDSTIEVVAETDSVTVHTDDKSGRRYSFNANTKETKWLFL